MIAKAILIYFAAISVISVIFTVSDKIAAKSHGSRVPESVLMTLGFIGGAVAMYVTMNLIRHKTKHAKFMIGLPIFIALHCGIAVYLIKSL